jgi:hypothetical protein
LPWRCEGAVNAVENCWDTSLKRGWKPSLTWLSLTLRLSPENCDGMRQCRVTACSSMLSNICHVLLALVIAFATLFVLRITHWPCTITKNFSSLTCFLYS